jgi:uncharacterized protein YyaL (SSP411 family)
VPNALAQETSPYLRQHAENPVDWLPWGPEALNRARAQDRPLLVSIGYSACHWCHVMERESFEDPRTAELMNENFVCIKVDREERPDVDALYMEAVQGMTGRGGWPLNIFLTPEQLPFFGGTYFPPDSRGGMPAWTQVLQAIAEAWSERREEIRAGGESLRERLSGGARLDPSTEPFDASRLDDAVARLAEQFDQRHGGFGGAPKFPPSSVIDFLVARASVRSDPLATPAADMALRTLRAMAEGGIHDILGGGFHRYAVDTSWTVPHFEKMLYDNALLARAYLRGFQASGEIRLLEICTDTLDWALREMRAPEGGFYAALDADSGGIEGRFYVWTVAELEALLAEDAAPGIAWLGLTEEGNFQDPHHPQTGLNVLTDRGPRPDRDTRERIRARLLETRETRERPGLDDKRLTSWNALMIAALADAGAAVPDSPYLQAATACAEFVERELRDASGRLLRTYNDGRAKIDAYLEDHALLLEALIALFEASCEERWFLSATALADEMIGRFADPERGGFFSTASDGEALITRRKDLEDSPIPSGSSSAALGLLRLSQLSGNEEYERHSLAAMALVSEIAPRLPSAFGHMLQALHWRLEPARPIACPIPASSNGPPRQPEPGRA